MPVRGAAAVHHADRSLDRESLLGHLLRPRAAAGRALSDDRRPRGAGRRGPDPAPGPVAGALEGARLRILFGSELFWPYVGGIERLAAELLPRLARRGHRFHVVTGHGEKNLPDQDRLDAIPITRFPFRKAVEGRDPEEILTLRRELDALREEFAPDLVHVFGVGSSLLFLASPPAASARPRLLVTLQNVLPPGSERDPEGLVRRTLRGADWVVTCSANLLATMRTIEPGIAERSSAIVNGIAPPRIEPAPLPADPPVLLCPARLMHQKGLDVALVALSLLAHRPEVRLVIAGEGPEGPTLRAQARRLGIDGRVEFLGLVSPDRMPSILNEATVVLMPSRWEGLPVAALEAAMLARPVVATDVGGVTEIVVDGETGLIVEPEDPESLARTVERLLDDPAFAASLGMRARERALAGFTVDRSAERYDALYGRLGGAGRATGTPG